MTGTPEGSTESGFMEKPGIEPATPGLQGIALIHYTTGAFKNDFFFKNILYVVRLEPTISTLSAIRSIQMAKRDSQNT